MNDLMISVEQYIHLASKLIWPIFLPFMLLLGIYISYKTFFVIQPKTTTKATLKWKHIVGPASISLGAMIGTGAIIGVLGSISIFIGQGQMHFEAIALWALLGACIMVPVSYCETLNAKIMHKTPKEYIASLLSKKMAVIYIFAFCALYIFGFGGFQFSGIDAIISIISTRYFFYDLTSLQRYVFIVLPILAIIATIILSKKHSIFMHSMTYMITIAVVGYFIFFVIFVSKTASHIPIFIDGMLTGLQNPIYSMMGIPLGFILGMQRVLQTSETGLGALAMAASEAKSKPREAALISMLTTIVTIFASIVVTTYIVSYGASIGIIKYPANPIMRLVAYIDTAVSVTGTFGLVVLCLFTVLSALTTLLGSYFFLSNLFSNQQNKNIIIYISIIFIAGTLAIFGFNIIFDAVDLLLFIVAGIHMLSLAIFVSKHWKQYEIIQKEIT